MTASNVPRLMITGTDTNVGKTHVTCLIARQLRAAGQRVAAYKPVCSGAITSPAGDQPGKLASPPRWDDIERIKNAIGEDWSDETICPQRFLLPLAPPIAARAEGRRVDFDLLVDGANRFGNVDLLLIEGAGGWLSPITETQSVADLAVELRATVLIVARTGLGTINHTLLTVEAIRSRGLSVGGVVLNSALSDSDDLSTQTNATEIEARSGAAVLGTVLYNSHDKLYRDGSPVSIKWQTLAAR